MTKEPALLSGNVGQSPQEDIALLCFAVYRINKRKADRIEIAKLLKDRGAAAEDSDVDKVIAMLPIEVRP